MIEPIRKVMMSRYVPDWLKRALRSSYRAVFLTSATAVPSAPVNVASRSEIEVAIGRIYQLALKREPSAGDRQQWADEVVSQRISLARALDAIATSPEAVALHQRVELLPEVSNGRFVQFTYEKLLDRSPGAAEVVAWDHRLTTLNLGRSELALSLFSHCATKALGEAEALPAQDPNLSPLMGTDRFVNITEWREKAAKLGSVYPPVKPKIYESLRIKREPEILVSIIASLYCGGEYIERYLENITSQTIFTDRCELIIIDADSPENEAATIARYMERFPNIVYHRADSRIGIYEAWNLGVRMARGRYLTNANMDDLRRFDSFERQAEILEKFPFVDVVYQDFWYSFDGHAPFDKSAATGFKSELPIITPYNLMQSNSPHNAPMWRQELHDAVGMFDDTYRSAGDYDFWLRCAQAGKVFFKVNDPHVIYFVNPEGLSTKPNTRGLDEANRSTRLHGRNILSPRLLASDDAFLTEVSRVQGSPIELTESERKTPDWRYLAAQRALRALRVNTAASRNRSSD